jgi:hypothetical protein
VERHREGELETRQQDGVEVHRSFPRQLKDENRTVAGA